MVKTFLYGIKTPSKSVFEGEVFGKQIVYYIYKIHKKQEKPIVLFHYDGCN